MVKIPGQRVNGSHEIREMVEFGSILHTEDIAKAAFAHPKPHPLIAFYQASSVPMVNQADQAVISVIRLCKVIGTCMKHFQKNCWKGQLARCA